MLDSRTLERAMPAEFVCEPWFTRYPSRPAVMTTIAEQLSAYAAGLRYEDLQPEVVRQAKRLIVDTVGCALGGAASEPARIARLRADTVVRPHRHDGVSLPHAQDRNTMYWFTVRHPVLDLVEVILRFALGITRQESQCGRDRSNRGIQQNPRSQGTRQYS